MTVKAADLLVALMILMHQRIDCSTDNTSTFEYSLVHSSHNIVVKWCNIMKDCAHSFRDVGMSEQYMCSSLSQSVLNRLSLK